MKSSSSTATSKMLLFALMGSASSAFRPAQTHASPRRHDRGQQRQVFVASTVLEANKDKNNSKKGFGNASNNAAEPKNKIRPPADAAVVADSSAEFAAETKPGLERKLAGPAESSSSPAGGSESSGGGSNAGRRALEEMRRQRAEDRDAELRRVREMVRADAQVQEAPRTAAIPEPVAQRMGRRMLPFVGLPLFGGMGAFVAFWYLATYRNVEFQPSLVAGSTIGILVIGLVGITYSLMSASWDPDREGSALGVEEFQRNVDNIREGLRRSRENAVLREKMAGLSSTEIEAALTDLEKREAIESTRQQSLQNKLKDELE